MYVPPRPAIVAVRHSEPQRANRKRAEMLALYKELKHNHINRLDRIITLLYCLLVPSWICHIFSALATDWVLVSRPNSHHSVGLVFSCYLALVGMCIDSGSSLYSRSVHDALTGEVVCEFTDSSARAFISVIWSLGGLELIFITVSLILLLRISRRPTRSGMCVVVLSLLSVDVPCSIANVVLFYLYTRCERRECSALHLSPPECRIEYGWGLNMYLASIFFDLCACITSIYLCSYPGSLRSRAKQLLGQLEKRQQEEWQKAQSRAVWHKSFSISRSERSRERAVPTKNVDVDTTPFLTATELNVVIDGADDWVYDDKSDLFYSFMLDSFWDPTTRCYYNRELQSWLVAPDGQINLREGG
ncbi:unnamed protein product [Trypanosoma congolense IL3000]|uniref:WGS project CAEQ00000000 data, annotated contig 697 n=1 Tax=Trypanosoma congolense (strain IL3000) TaxID=1068625 RepID=F9WHV6_TRYCI|nr:unnamed protein product [Trypanosoma congolense IL3000]